MSDIIDNIQRTLGLQRQSILKAFGVEDGLEKALNHKYIRKELASGGGVNYIYEEKEVEPSKIDIKENKEKLKKVHEEVLALEGKLKLLDQKLELDFQSSDLHGSKTFKQNIIYRVGFSHYLGQNEQRVQLLKQWSDLNSEIYRLKNQVEWNKIPTGSVNGISSVLYSATRDLDKFTQQNPALIPFREINQNVTKDDYYIGTDTIFDKIELDKGVTVESKWEELKKIGEFTRSPKSSSEYIVVENGVYRKADHWGRCASCWWLFNGTGEEWGYNIGFSKFENFKVNGLNAGYYVPNPITIEKAPALINESLHNLQLIKNSFKLNKTQSKAVEGKETELKEFLQRIQKNNDDSNKN